MVASLAPAACARLAGHLASDFPVKQNVMDWVRTLVIGRLRGLKTFLT